MKEITKGPIKYAKGDKYMGVKHMQDVSAHLEFLRDTEHKRRHMMRCKYIKKPERMCKCSKSPCYRVKCCGSSHCDYYEER